MAPDITGRTLDDHLATARALVDAGAFAACTTLSPDGGPRSHVMWIDHDGDHFLLNTEVHRQKVRDVARDPRIALLVWHPQDPYRYTELRGRVVATRGGQEARRHIDAVSQRYRGVPYDEGAIGSERVVLVIEVHAAHAHEPG